MIAICGSHGSGLGGKTSFDTALLYLTTVANALILADEANPLKDAVSRIDPSLTMIEHARKGIDRPACEDWAFKDGVVSLYDTQVALCEFHRWGQPMQSTTANRMLPEQCFDQRMKRERAAEAEAGPGGDEALPGPPARKKLRHQPSEHAPLPAARVFAADQGAVRHASNARIRSSLAQGSERPDPSGSAPAVGPSNLAQEATRE